MMSYHVESSDYRAYLPMTLQDGVINDVLMLTVFCYLYSVKIEVKFLQN